MDGLIFIAAIVATVIASLVVRLGYYFHLEELRTGKTARGWNLYWVTTCGAGGALIYLREATPFLSHLFMVTIGVLIGLGLVRFLAETLPSMVRQLAQQAEHSDPPKKQPDRH